MAKEDITKETGGFTEKTEGFESKLDSAKEILETLMNPDITLQDSVKAYRSVVQSESSRTSAQCSRNEFYKTIQLHQNC